MSNIFNKAIKKVKNLKQTDSTMEEQSNQKTNEEKEKGKRSYKSLILTFWAFVIIPLLFLFILFFQIGNGNMGFMPNFQELENPNRNLASEIISSDAELLGKYYKENRTVITFDNISSYVLDGLVATEDERFHEHSGIDAMSLLRVGVKTILMSKGSSGGGSTVTQQLAKNLFPRDTIRSRSKLGRASHMVVMKFKEWVTAVKLERSYTKPEILALYLNTVPFGSQTYGIKSAARTFFNTTPDSLKIEEAAILVGLLKATTKYSPIRNPERALERRNTVLHQMNRNDYITDAAYDSLKKLPIKLAYNVRSHNKGLSPYFREYLRMLMNAKKPKKEDYYYETRFNELLREWNDNPLYGWCNKNLKPDSTKYNLYKDGLKIYTTINSKMQRYAEEATVEHMAKNLQKAFYKDMKKQNKAPFSWDMTEEQIKRLMYISMRRSERYRVLKNANLDSAQIRKNFDTPTNMRLFRWKTKIDSATTVFSEEFDTLMTPYDSVIYYKSILRAGFMSMEPQTGYVRAYVGGINYKYFKYDHVSVAKRQVGSTFKPFLYTLAMISGKSPCYQVPNVSTSFKLLNVPKPYTPKYSASKHENEMVSLKYGLANSLNQISAYLMKEYKPEAIIQVAQKMGVKSHIDPVPSICVGSAEVHLSEMVGSYCTFANKGVAVEPIFVSRIEDKNGNIISSFSPKKKEAISEETAYLMLNMMRAVIKEGTSTRMAYRYKLRNDIAGKTGTTNNNSDGWFIGITPYLVSGAWVGGEERSIHFRSTKLGQGANMALPIWALYMKKVYADQSLGIEKKARFEKPAYEFSVETDCSKYNQNKDNGIDENMFLDDELNDASEGL